MLLLTLFPHLIKMLPPFQTLLFLPFSYEEDALSFPYCLQKQSVYSQDWNLYRDKTPSWWRGRWMLFYSRHLLTFPDYFEGWPWDSSMTTSVRSVDQVGYQDPLFWFVYFRTIESYSHMVMYLVLWSMQYIFTHVGCYIK